MKLQDLRQIIKEEIQNVLNEATDFSSFQVLDPGRGWFEIKYGTGASFLAFYKGNWPSKTVTLVGSQPQEQKYFDEIAQMVGGTVEPDDVHGFKLTIPTSVFTKLFSGVNEGKKDNLNEWALDMNMARSIITPNNIENYGDYDPSTNTLEVENGSDAMADFFDDVYIAHAGEPDNWYENEKVTGPLRYRFEQAIEKAAKQKYGPDVTIEYI